MLNLILQFFSFALPMYLSLTRERDYKLKIPKILNILFYFFIGLGPIFTIVGLIYSGITFLSTGVIDTYLTEPAYYKQLINDILTTWLGILIWFDNLDKLNIDKDTLNKKTSTYVYKLLLIILVVIIFGGFTFNFDIKYN